MEESDVNGILRRLPSVESLLRECDDVPELAALPLNERTRIIRQVVEHTRIEVFDAMNNTRAAIQQDESVRVDLKQRILARCAHIAQAEARPFYRRAINAAGIILHTGLGRAVLPKAALRQINEELQGYSVLQQSVETGRRSRRDAAIEDLLRRLTGAEAATVVNNNAGATMLVIHALAAGREVIVSRGQLIEIGGSFRLPEMIALSGARLVEVGTTNKTHPRDYTAAITENTGAILRVHPSNYRIHGFTKDVSTAELAAIAKPHRLPVIDDLGAGALLDFSRFGFEKEPTIRESMEHGADVALSSADKLIGGPQAGLIMGRREIIEKIRKSPMARVLRVDKLTTAALEATLRLFLDEETAMREVPTLFLLRRPLEELESAAAAILERLDSRGCAKSAEIRIHSGVSFMGGGSLPEQQLPTCLVAVKAHAIATDSLAAKLRARQPAIFGRISDDRVLLDVRTMLPGEELEVAEALAAILEADAH